VVIRKGKEDVIYGITYVDHKTKCVFNGSDLGKQYSAKAILEKCGQEIVPESATIHKGKANNKQVKEKQPAIPKPDIKTQDQQEQGQYWTLPLNWNTPAPGNDYVPYELKKKKKRKKKGLSI
jgi:hypothetical protein